MEQMLLPLFADEPRDFVLSEPVNNFVVGDIVYVAPEAWADRVYKAQVVFVGREYAYLSRYMDDSNRTDYTIRVHRKTGKVKDGGGMCYKNFCGDTDGFLDEV